MVFSNPLLFPRAAVSDAPASLVDLLPTLLDLAGAPLTGALDGASLAGVLAGAGEPDREGLQAASLDAIGATASAASARRERALFTYDDHQAGTARRDAPGQPNRLRSVREQRWKYSVYLDPDGQASPEYELYDLEADPNESHNLLERDSGRPRRRAAAAELGRLHEALLEECRRTATPVFGLEG